MTVAHLTLGSRDSRAAAEFLCHTMRWKLVSVPGNAPPGVAWIDISTQQDGSQQIHIIQLENFSVSPFENEFGRHLAVFHDGQDMLPLRNRIRSHGGELMEPFRSTPFDRFFFRDPLDGYVFEVIHRQQWTAANARST